MSKKGLGLHNTAPLTDKQMQLLRELVRRQDALAFHGLYYSGTTSSLFYDSRTVSALLRRGYFVRRPAATRGYLYTLF